MNSFLIGLVLILAGGLLPLLLFRWLTMIKIVGIATCASGSLLGLITATRIILTGQTIAFSLPLTLPGASFAIMVDSLAAFFLAPLFLISLLGVIYGSGYMAKAGGLEMGRHYFFYNLLVLSMALVISSANAVLFLFAWECMSLASFFLVISDHQVKHVRRAGFIYLLATHLGAAALLALFLLAGAKSGSLDFATFHILQGLAPLPAGILFVLALGGFGSKAGLFPFHVWLPEAHPAAPSHVSALMSAVMVKTAIYGLLRFLSFLPTAPAWWGGVLLALGVFGGLFGIGMAATQRDLKRSLAYSTVENVGLIFLALGFWLYATAIHHYLPAVLALAGGLMHIWNHCLFKSLLFMGAGSLLHCAGTRNLNRMGGLLRRMPYTGFLLIIGAMAVSALPPMGGLVGEWFIYRSLLEGGITFQGLAASLPIVLVGLMAMIGAMVLLVMVRIVGIGLSGESRQQSAATVHEAKQSMLGSMAVLAMICFVGGLFPGLLIKPVVSVVRMISPGSDGLLHTSGNLPYWIGETGAGMIFLVIIILLGSRLLGPRQKGVAPTWGCGYLFPTSRMSYSAEGFSELAQNSFYCDGLCPDVSTGQPLALLPGRTIFAHAADDFFLQSIYKPLFQAVAGFCSRMRRLQSGFLHIYIFYVLAAMILLLSWLAFT